MTTTILIVDDSPVERLLVEGLLRRNPDYRMELAENGKEALEKLLSCGPDLVITDLIMPEMDGLELVRTLRQHYPQIPAILMTAYGDESTVIEALEAGAASYVPKTQKAERLMSTVERVAGHARTDRSDEQLQQSLLEYHCRFALDNDRRLIRSLVEQIQQAMASVGFNDVVERIRIGEALEEALLNAMYHGNLEISHDELATVRAELDDYVLDRMIEERCKEDRIRQRKILVVAHLTENEARFVIRDEGRGMFVACDKAADGFAAAGNRGMALIHSLMDEITFNRAGNEMVICKRLSVVA